MENLNSSDKYIQTDLEQSKLNKNQTENACEKVKNASKFLVTKKTEASASNEIQVEKATPDVGVEFVTCEDLLFESDSDSDNHVNDPTFKPHKSHKQLFGRDFAQD